MASVNSGSSHPSRSAVNFAYKSCEGKSRKFRHFVSDGILFVVQPGHFSLDLPESGLSSPAALSGLPRLHRRFVFSFLLVRKPSTANTRCLSALNLPLGAFYT
jgi:hypothetical protein